MARLKELTCKHPLDLLQREDLGLTLDVVIRQRYAKLIVREAKTSGKAVSQTIKLVWKKSALCMVAAFIQRLKEAGLANTSLFGFKAGSTQYNLTRVSVVMCVQRIMNNGSFVGLMSHSFHLGGASLRYTLRFLVEKIRKLGRWKYDCYQLYIKQYTEAEMEG